MAETATPTDSSGPKEPVIDAKTFSLGLPEGAGHKGTITVNDNAPIESIILAYQVVHKLARHISDRVIEHNKQKNLPVFFHNAADFAAIRELRACLALC